MGTAAAMAAILVAGGAQAQQQQAPNPETQQFGPRANPAQRQQAQAPQPEVIATHGDWTVQCQEQQVAGADGQAVAGRACGMTQTVQGNQPGVGLTLVVVKGEEEGSEVTMLRVMAPIGVYLPTGVALEIDGEAVGRVPFTRCVPQTCIAIAEASPPTLAKMKAGGIANFIIYEGPGSGMGLELSLMGFTAALGELDKL